MILINVTKAVRYLPMSRSSSQNKKRADIMYELAMERGTTIDEEEVQFAIYLSHVIKLQFDEAIKTQKVHGKSMSSIYTKLSDRYNKSKPVKHQNKFWLNSGELVKRIRVWKSQSGINIGFPPEKKHPKSKAKLVDILNWMENGNKVTPARPIFKLIIIHISKNIDAYFNHYIKLQMKRA